MSAIQICELPGCVPTVTGMPLAIFVFMLERRRECGNKKEAKFRSLRNIFNSSLQDIRLRQNNTERSPC